MYKIICIKLIRFYQLFISPLKPKCCRYYPSCSEYALWQFNKNNILKAFVAVFLRILKCNPFFKGGIDYPKICKNNLNTGICFKPHNNALKQLNYLYIPCKDNQFFLIKIIFSKDNPCQKTYPNKNVY
ncbi:membrane protein insertion efficiency factor YidD [Campylobacter sp. RM16704]|uniref:membrane protein insertion efficiency factor YidD n=1 Tax=Campylobacter sp. RM16704 TaxID=1500960 RepID=UPI00057D8BD9|nr:membrane protein insertion efficiency factor YidD [Campylobacter sp. RM16704]AJC86059.1 membrane protein insertion efficiency factor, YidD family [Campylobacter sp. RM16704]